MAYTRKIKTLKYNDHFNININNYDKKTFNSSYFWNLEMQKKLKKLTTKKVTENYNL